MASQARLSDDEAGAPPPWFLSGEDGRLLYAQRWEPWPNLSPATPSAGPAVVLVHGFGEHIGRYEHLGRAMAASGLTMWAMDLAGFGRSDGPRAVVPSLARAVSDIARLVAAATGPVTTGGPDNRPVLMGHSMGGAFAAAYAIEHPETLSGLVVSAPSVHLAARPGWQMLGARALAQVAPRAGVGRVVPAQLSRDPDVVAAFIHDPLVWHGSVPARTAVEMLNAAKMVMKRAGEIKLPLLVLHGEADPIVPVGSSRAFFEEAGSADKQLRVFKGLLHEPFQEVGKQEVIAVLLEWLAKH